MAKRGAVTGSGGRHPYRCSFCGKGQDEVKRLIAGPGAVYICDACIELCQEIITEEPASNREAKAFQRAEKLTAVLLDVTPKEIMRDPRFIADALSGHRNWMFDVGSNGDVRMLINVDGAVVAQILESLGEAHDEDAGG